MPEYNVYIHMYVCNLVFVWYVCESGYMRGIHIGMYLCVDG